MAQENGASPVRDGSKRDWFEQSYIDVPWPVLVLALGVIVVHMTVALTIGEGWLGFLVGAYGFVLAGCLPEVYLTGKRSRRG